MARSNYAIVIFALLLIAGGVFAYCGVEKSINVPAVVGESGGRLLQITVRSVPGNGSVFFSTSPNVGVSTQQSQQAAFDNALYFEKLNSTGCDYLFSIQNMGESNYVEGPSAGTGMTLDLLAVITNRTVRQDVAFTGGIGDGGQVTAVGGLVEKATAAAASGMYAIVTPRQEIFEKLMLADVSEKTGIRIIEAGTLSEAAGIAFSPQGSPLESSNSTIEAPSLPENLTGNQQAFSDADLKEFAKVSQAMIAVAQERLKDSRAGQNSTGDYGRIYAFFEKDIENQKELQAKGYLFTAANNVFTHLVDISLLRTGTVSESDLEQAYEVAQACVMSIPATERNIGNFEWVSAGELRKTWALDKINTTSIGKATGSEENYLAYRDLVYAQNWCLVSRLVLGAASDYTGVAVNMSVLAPYAKANIDSAQNAIDALPVNDSDLQWHLDMAKNDFGRGEYYAAVIDSDYVSSFIQSDKDYIAMNKSLVGAEIGRLYNASFASAWAKIYQTQGRYLYDAAGMDPAKGMSAYKILKFAQSLDQSFAQAQSILLEKGKLEGAPAGAKSGGIEGIDALMDQYGAQAFALAVLVAASIAALLGYRHFSGAAQARKPGRRGRR
ncbi:MAG: S16 family serine protease [Candidatus Micrarchaeia archaeon]